MTIGTAPSYLSKNHYSYCFRIRIPLDIQAMMSRKELRYSLRTGHLTAAKMKARYLAGKVQLLFRDIQKGQFKDMNLDKSQMQEMLKRFMQEIIRNYDKPVINMDHADEWERSAFRTKEGLEDTIDFIEEIKADLNLKMQTGDYKLAGRRADRLLNEEGFAQSEINKASPEYAHLCSGIYKAMINGCEYKQKKLSGNVSDEIDDILDSCIPGNTQPNLETEPPEVIAPQQKPSPKTLITVKELIPKYMEEGKQDGRWSGKTPGEIESALKAFAELIGEATCLLIKPGYNA